MTVDYRSAGVDLAIADEVSDLLASRLGTGLFAGRFPASELKKYHKPVLLTSMDGIGSKVRLARRLGRMSGLGQDIVHHCVNDIAVHGARPLFFLDYLAFHHIDPKVVERIISSIEEACRNLGIALAGGETAEMPSVYRPGELDVAGAIVGVAEESRIVDGHCIVPGDLVIGFPSSGLHTNGHSLAQHVLPDDAYDRFDALLGTTIGEALLESHRCYLDDVQRLLATETVRGFAHITGGGIEGNLSRIVPAGAQAVIDLPESPRLFGYLAGWGISRQEMRRVFNMGIGLIAICRPEVVRVLPEQARTIGRIEATDDLERRVVFTDGD